MVDNLPKHAKSRIEIKKKYEIQEYIINCSFLFTIYTYIYKCNEIYKKKTCYKSGVVKIYIFSLKSIPVY